MTINECVEKYLAKQGRSRVGETASQGGEGGGSDPDSRNQLLAELKKIERDNQKWFRVAISLLVILFFAGLLAVLVNLDRPDLLKNLVYGLGISTAGCAAAVGGLWERKVRLEILVRLALFLEGAALTAAIEALSRSRSVAPSSTGR